MRKVITLALAVGVALSAASAAEARDGCGRGGWRGPHGHCHFDRGRGPGGPAFVAPGGLVIGQYYGDRGGYWDGQRYWQHRERHHGGWRYR